MNKKVLALALSAFMACASFAGCGNAATTGGAASSAASTTAAAAGETTAAAASETAAADANAAAKAVADRKAAADKNKSHQKVTMAMLNFVGPPTGLADINGEISKYTEEKLGLDFEMTVLDAASYKQQVTLMLSSGEDLDIFNAITLGYSFCVNTGLNMDLEQDGLLANYGQGITQTLDPSYVDGCRVNGVLYGLPNQRDMAIGLDCMAIGAQYLDAIGYDYKSQYKSDTDEYVKTDIATISDIFSKLHAKYPDKVVFVPQTASVNQCNDYDAVGGDIYGVLLNGAQDLKVADLFSSDTYKNFCQRIYDWNQAGYMSKDAMTNNISATAQVKANTALAYATAGKPGIRTQETGLCGQPMVIFQMGGDMLKSSSISGLSWCINSKSKDPVAAMQFLDLAYTDPVVSNLLCWGREGKEYKKTEDGHIDFADGVDASNSAWFNNVNWEMPNQFIAEIFVGNDLTIWDRMAKFNSESQMSKAVGFTFDNAAVTSEYAALTNIYNEYQKQLEFGFVDPATGIAEMVEKMKAAGLEKYMAEKQTQLDAWATAVGK